MSRGEFSICFGKHFLSTPLIPVPPTLNADLHSSAESAGRRGGAGYDKLLCGRCEWQQSERSLMSPKASTIPQFPAEGTRTVKLMWRLRREENIANDKYKSGTGLSVCSRLCYCSVVWYGRINPTSYTLRDDIELDLLFFFPHLLLTPTQHDIYYAAAGPTTHTHTHTPGREGAEHDNTLLRVWLITQFNNVANILFSIMLCYIFRAVKISASLFFHSIWLF